MFRTLLFWCHLVVGVLAGLVVAIMSLTGVLLTYERQINTWVEVQKYPHYSTDAQRMSLDALVNLALDKQVSLNTVTIEADKYAPLRFSQGRTTGPVLDSVTGKELVLDHVKLDTFFHTVESLHRWLALEGEMRSAGRQVTGVSNVLFLFLIISGIYLWFPNRIKWPYLKVRLLFRRSYPSTLTRDFHWHHILGFWSFVPLFFVVFSGAVISYSWAANFMYWVAGAEPVTVSSSPVNSGLGKPEYVSNFQNRNKKLEVLFQRAIEFAPSNWNRVTMRIPADSDETVDFNFDYGNGAQRHMITTMQIDRVSGATYQKQEFKDQPLRSRLRILARFLHTGEVLGFWGQTLAGLVSLLSLVMVWTGLALAWRRLVVPLLQRE